MMMLKMLLMIQTVADADSDMPASAADHVVQVLISLVSCHLQVASVLRKRYTGYRKNDHC